MSDSDTTEDAGGNLPQVTEDRGGKLPPREPDDSEQPSGKLPEGDADEDPDDAPETFPREVVEKLRQENGKYRQRAQQADTLARRLHTELVRATGRLADPTDLAFDESHLDDPDALADALADLLDRKPHLVVCPAINWP